MAIAGLKKNNRHLPGGRKCSFYNRVPLPDLPLLEFDDAMSIANSKIDVRWFSFRLIHLLRVLGIFWLSYITSPDPQCPVRVE
jgi:hypothetical protein